MKRLVYIALIALAACTSKPTTSNDIDSSDVGTVELLDSLMAWTPDTIKKTNMPMVLLMDTLYRFVRSEEYVNNLDENMRWMDAYREQLCNYYDRNKLGEDDISSFSKADSVMQSAERLWELDTDYSTMGMIISNDIERTRRVFQHYNEFAKLLAKCDSEEEKQILEREFEAWGNLEGAVSSICANLIDLRWCGGSIAGPAKTSAYLKILDAHLQLYKREGSWLSGNWDCGTNGVYPNCAKELLISCCRTAYKEGYCAEYASENEYYQKIADTKNAAIKLLPPLIDEWIAARKEWEDRNGNGCTITFYNLNTGEVLEILSTAICVD